MEPTLRAPPSRGAVSRSRPSVGCAAPGRPRRAWTRPCAPSRCGGAGAGLRSGSWASSGTPATPPQTTPARRLASQCGLCLPGSPPCFRESPGPPRELSPGTLGSGPDDLLQRRRRQPPRPRPTRATQPGTALRASCSRKPRPPPPLTGGPVNQPERGWAGLEAGRTTNGRPRRANGRMRGGAGRARPRRVSAARARVRRPQPEPHPPRSEPMHRGSRALRPPPRPRG